MKLSVLVLLAFAIGAAHGQKPERDKIRLGKVGLLLRASSIYRMPETSSPRVYRAAKGSYIVSEPWDSQWDTVLLQDGSTGFALSKDVSIMPYEVTAKRRIGGKTDKLAGLALGQIGRPVDKGMRGGGFVAMVFGMAGKELPADLDEQMEIGKPVAKLEQLVPGDRLYFWDKRANRVGFSAIFVGKGYFVGALPGHTGIASDYVGKKPWLKMLFAARR